MANKTHPSTQAIGLISMLNQSITQGHLNTHCARIHQGLQSSSRGQNSRAKDTNVAAKLWPRTRNVNYFLLLLHCVCSLLGNGVTGFNLDVSYPTVLTIPEKQAYFGYSVAMYAGEDETWLLVGAPKSNIRGEVYKCEYEEGKHNNCSIINIKKDDAATPDVKDMFGMTLKIGRGKQLLVCAPFWTMETRNNVNQKEVIHYDLLGICYLTEDFTANTPDVSRLVPCEGNKGTYHEGDEHGNCEAGLSAAFTKDGNNIVLGTTGSYYRQGSVMLVKLPLTDDIRDLPLHVGEKKIKPDESKQTIMQSYDNNYLGYSVATGRSLGNSQLLFVSAPRRYGFDLLGQVVVYDDRLEALYNFTGKQTGEYFGYGLAAVDLNNDHLDDVIVGSPLYSDFEHKLAENGRVYVFYQEKADSTASLKFSEPVIIEGNKSMARLGHMISSIGDINQDGYNDIAIGAPYSSNGENSFGSDGSVFIYNGGPEGLRIPASQEIEGLSLDSSMAGFGHSISGDKDVDRNGYPDVLAGAYISNQAVLLRARPVAEIESVVTVSPETIDIEAKSCSSGPSFSSCFEITTCFSYSGKNLPPSIALTYVYDVDSGKSGDDKRAFIQDESPKNITLVRESASKSRTECVKETAYLKVDIRDKLTEIDVTVSHSLIARDQPVEPVLNQIKPAYSSARVRIFKDCGADDECQADLRVTTELDKTAVYMEQEAPIVLLNVVKNLGEPAFLTSLVVEFPEHVYYVGTQEKSKTSGPVNRCSSVDRFVICELGNPMKRNALSDVGLKFRVSGLQGNVSELTFKSFANSTNPVNSTSDVAISLLAVEVKADVIIYNSSSPAIIFLGAVDSKDVEKKEMGNLTSVNHVYELMNRGPSDIASGTIEISWPLKTAEGDYALELVEIVETSSVTCDPIKSRSRRSTTASEVVSADANYYYCGAGAECLSIACHVGHLRRQQEVSIAIQSTLLLSTVLQNDLDSYIRSDFKFTVDKFPYEINPGPGPTIKTEVTTKCLYVREPEAKDIQWWIIAIAIAAGVLVLALLVFVLWKCGFFKRKRKPQADDLAQREKLNPKEDVEDDETEMEQYLK